MTQQKPFQANRHFGPQQRVSAHYHQQYPQPLVYRPASASSGGGGAAIHDSSSARQKAHPKRVLLASGSMLALATMVITPSVNRLNNPVNAGVGDVCIKQIDQKSLVSRDELRAVLNLDKNISKDEVLAVLDQPNCVLQPRAGENGVQVDREAYPLEFDPQTWFVLQYQEEKFAGFDFSFR